MLSEDQRAEIRRLRADGMQINAIAQEVGVGRTTVLRALDAGRPTQYQRKPAGAAVDAYESLIIECIRRDPTMTARDIAAEVNYPGGITEFRNRVTALKAQHRDQPASTHTENSSAEADTRAWSVSRVAEQVDRLDATQRALLLAVASGSRQGAAKGPLAGATERHLDEMPAALPTLNSIEEVWSALEGIQRIPTLRAHVDVLATRTAPSQQDLVVLHSPLSVLAAALGNVEATLWLGVDAERPAESLLEVVTQDLLHRPDPLIAPTVQACQDLQQLIRRIIVDLPTGSELALQLGRLADRITEPAGRRGGA